jgi:hypothetical protein
VLGAERAGDLIAQVAQLDQAGNLRALLALSAA